MNSFEFHFEFFVVKHFYHEGHKIPIKGHKANLFDTIEIDDYVMEGSAQQDKKMKDGMIEF